MDYLDDQIEGRKGEEKKGRKYKKKRSRNLMKERAALKKQATEKNKVCFTLGCGIVVLLEG